DRSRNPRSGGVLRLVAFAAGAHIHALVGARYANAVAAWITGCRPGLQTWHVGRVERPALQELDASPIVVAVAAFVEGTFRVEDVRQIVDCRVPRRERREAEAPLYCREDRRRRTACVDYKVETEVPRACDGPASAGSRSTSGLPASTSPVRQLVVVTVRVVQNHPER